MVNQRAPHQGSESELEDVIVNMASEAQALETVQAIKNLNNVPVARMAPLGLPIIEHAPIVVEPNPLPRADVNIFDNFESLEDVDDEVADWSMTYLKRCMWKVAKHLSPKSLDAVEGHALNLSRSFPNQTN